MNIMNILGFAPTAQQREAGGDELRVSTSDVRNQALFLPMLLQLFGANAAITVKTKSQNEMPTNSPSLLFSRWSTTPDGSIAPSGRRRLVEDGFPAMNGISKASAVQLPFVSIPLVEKDDSVNSDGKDQAQSTHLVAQQTTLSTMAVNKAVSPVVPKVAQNEILARQNEVATELLVEANGKLASLAEAIAPVVADESVSTKLGGVKVHNETTDGEASVSAAIREVKSSMQKPVSVQPNMDGLTVSEFKSVQREENVQPEIFRASTRNDAAALAMIETSSEAKTQPEFARTVTREDAAPFSMPVKADETKIVESAERFNLATAKPPTNNDIIVNFTTPKVNNPIVETAKAVNEANVFVSNESPNARALVTQSQGNGELNSPLVAKPTVNNHEINLADVKAIVVEQKDFASSELPQIATYGLVEKQKPKAANAQIKFSNTVVEQKPDVVTEIKSEAMPKKNILANVAWESILNESSTTQRVDRPVGSLRPSGEVAATVNTISPPQVSKPVKVQEEGEVKSSTREDNFSKHKVAAGKSIVVETVKSDFAKSLADNSKEFEPAPLREKHTNTAKFVTPNVDDTARLWRATTVEPKVAASSELSPNANVAQPMNNGEIETMAKAASQISSSHTQPTQHAAASTLGTEAASNLGTFSPMTDLSQTVLDQVTKNLVFSLKAKSSEIRVALKPESLGEVVMKVKMDDGKLSTQIDVNNVNVKAVLEANIAQLRDTLTSRGIEVQRIDIIADGQAAFGSPSGQNRSKQKSQNKNEANVDAIEQYKFLRTMGYNTMELTM